MKCWIDKTNCLETIGIQCRAFNYDCQCIDKVNAYIAELEDKLHRRNVMIKDLKVLLHKQGKWLEEANKEYQQLWSFITSNNKIMDIWTRTVKNR